MIISDVKINNYKSLQNIHLKNLENIVILTGKNSSGKSNLLEALWLFSKDFALVPESIPTNVPVEPNSHLWPNADTTNPINFKIRMRFTPHEIRQILPIEMIDALDLKRRNIDIEFERNLEGSKANLTWNTISVKMGDLIIIQDGFPVNKLYEFTIEEDMDGNENPVPISFIQSEAQNEVVKLYFSGITPEIINNIIGNLTKICKENIKMIHSARASPSINPNYGTRTLNIEQKIYAKILTEGQTLAHNIRQKWRKFVTDFSNLNPYNHSLNVVSGSAVVDETNITLPFHQIGGGTQGLISIIHELIFDVKPIMFIEEPENHLHPELQKKFFNYLNNFISPRSRETQIWLSTHSPFFLNKSDIKNVWVAKKKDDITEFNNLIDRVDLRNIIIELGVKPSDILFSDAILLVDGPTEEMVLPIWGNKLGIDLVDLGCDLIGIGGDEKGKYHLDMWRTITNDAQIPIFMILDSHAKNEATKLISANKINEEHCIVTDKHSIEEFYKKEYVIRAIFEEFGILLSETEFKNTKVSTIKKLLISKGMKIDNRNWWKPLIGIRVARMMVREDIPDTYRRILEKIKITLE